MNIHRRLLNAFLALMFCAVIAFGQGTGLHVSVRRRGALRITSSGSLPSAVGGTSYNFQFTAVEGKTPYVWSVASCQKTQADGITTASCAALLPAGLTLTTGGLLYGTPTETGDFSITVQVTDSKA